MYRCHVCQHDRVEPLLDFGPQVLANRYLTHPGEPEAKFSFLLGQCLDCNMVQIPNPVAPPELKARFDWIRYNEQEGHLDDLVTKIVKLPGVSQDATIGAISFKDDSTVNRFQRAGFSKTWRLELDSDLGVRDLKAGLETIQQAVTLEVADGIVRKRGPVDVLIARHILEHAHEPARFVEALRKLLKPEGYLVLEVPDCEPALTRKDYTMFWEEHVLYFTPDLFQMSLELWGFKPVHFERYRYTNENSLVAIVQGSRQNENVNLPATANNNWRKVALEYARAFPEYRQETTELLAGFRKTGQKIALFGAGHLSCAWLNFLQLEKFVEFVVDDHPQKKGLLMPGSRLPILGSAELVARDIQVCLLTLSPESEAKVIANNQSFVSKGGRFFSIFPGKQNSLESSVCA